MKYDITINGTIGWETSADFIDYQLKKHQGKRVDVRICSLGGYVTDGIDIYQMFKEHGDVHCHFVGMSASAATFLAMGAKSVDMVKNSLILIHNASSLQFAWGRYNKEQLDDLMKKLGKEREQLATIDALIASIYADRCNKTIEEVQEKMKVAAWITSEDALNFGLVDAIRDEVDEDEKKATNIVNSILPTDETLTELGLPALPEGYSQPVQNPTESEGILSKVAQLLGLKKPSTTITNEATTDNNAMLKIFMTLAALLNVEGFNLNEKNNIELTQDQMQAVENKMKEGEKTITDLQNQLDELKKAPKESKPEDVTEITNLKNQVQELQDKLTAANTQIENLKGKPADNDEVPGGAKTEDNEPVGLAFTNLFT